MTLLKFVMAWFYYSFYYILFSIFITIFINKLLKKLYLAPLIVNAVSIIILLIMIYFKLIDKNRATYIMYFNYVPTVFTSIVTNMTILLIRKIKNNYYE